jgi:hypothetical protein
MNKLGSILLLSLVMGGAYAQSTGGGVTMSTDPARAAAVENHAQELKARQSKEPATKPAATHKSTSKAKPKTSATHKPSTAKSAKPAKSKHAQSPEMK